MFRFVIPAVGLLMIGGWLFGNGSGVAAGVGAGFVFGKVLVVILLLGLASKLFWYRGGFGHRHHLGAWHGADVHHRAHQRSSQRRAGDRGPTSEEPSFEERFDEWHRMAHAKDEVDGWTEDV